MSPRVLAAGPPPLTEEAADAALDAIDFIAAQVRGIDTIDVTPQMQVPWRQHVSNCFPYVPLWTRGWFANAPFLVTMFRTQWPYLPPEQQAMLRQGWAAQLPYMLQMLEPVLQQSGAQLNPAMQPDVEAMRAQMDPELQATEQLFNHGMMSNTLEDGSTSMTTATIDLMHAMSGSS